MFKDKLKKRMYTYIYVTNIMVYMVLRGFCNHGLWGNVPYLTETVIADTGRHWQTDMKYILVNYMYLLANLNVQH